MKKLRLLIAAVFLGIFVWAVNVSAESDNRIVFDDNWIVIDNVEYINEFPSDSWRVAYYPEKENVERLVIRDEVNGSPVWTIIEEGFAMIDVQEVVLPSTLRFIYREAFWGSDIKTLTIPASVESVDDWLAKDCKNLETVYWNSKADIPEEAFWRDNRLREVRLTDGINKIKRSAFSECTALREINLPEGLTGIDVRAFSGCVNLKEVYIPSSVSYIATNAFEGIPGLVLKGAKNSYASYYAKAQGIPFECVGEAESPITNRPILSSVKYSGNTVTCSLLRKVPGARSYEFYVLYDYAAQSDRPYYDDLYIRRIYTEDTTATFYNLPKGDWKIVCLADFTNSKKTPKWSNEVSVHLSQQPAETPVITKAEVKGRNVTVTVKTENPRKEMGYDCVLAKSWDIVPEEKVYTIKNKRVSTITFKNVKLGTYYVAAHSFVRENVTSGLKVFGEWSEPKKIVVK